MDYLDNLYDQLSKVEIFEDMPECQQCDGKCNSDRRERWLLNDEAERLSCSLPGMIEIHGATFFQEGKCVNLREDGKCRIYEFRPLECRLNPVTFVERDGRLYWALNCACKLMQTDDEVRIDYFKDRASQYIDKIEQFISRDTWRELRTINRAINTFDPYVEGKDCITLREVRIG